MAISGPTSYISTTEEFITHWGVANTTLGAGNEIVLQGGFTLANLQTLLANLVAQRLLLTAKLNLQETARGDIEIKKATLLLRINQFNEEIRADYVGTRWEVALPNVPSINDGQGVFVPPLEDALTLWEQLNAALAPSAPVTLLGGYNQATFATDITALNAGYTSWRAAAKIVEITLAERNDIQDLIYPQLVSYRKKLPTRFPANHALVDTMPQLTPGPGGTPDAVVLSGVWLENQQKARLTWTASPASDLAHYEIRFCAGQEYNTDLETTIASIAKTAPRELLTNAGLPVMNNYASFKVYVVTTSNHERGSNAVSVQFQIALPLPPSPPPSPPPP